MHPNSTHQAHLQMSLVTSVSAFAQHSHHPSFHHGPQIHHPQPLPFPPIVHPAHHHHHHHHHPLLPPPRLDHKLSAFELPNPSNDFYKNSHLHPPHATIPPPSIPSLPNPAIAHHSSGIPAHPVAALPPINSNHTIVTHHTRFHQSPPSPAQTIKSNASTVEQSHDSAESPLVVDNIASPISVSSSSNNISTTISNTVNNNNSHAVINNNNPNSNNNHTGTTNGSVRSNDSTNNAQHNGLLDLLMNPEKCQVIYFNFL